MFVELKMTRTPLDPIRVLSLDVAERGNGLPSFLILDHLMRYLNLKCPGYPARPCEVFDLIFGSGIRGLLALMVWRLGISTKAATSKY